MSLVDPVGREPERVEVSAVSVQTGVVASVRVTHRTATVDQVGGAGSGDAETDVSGLLAAPGVEEAYVLRTCNRTEAYVVADDPADARAVLETYVAEVPADAVRYADHEASLRHLLRVAAGLESMVVGEDRVLGQVREAYELARGVGGVGPVLEEAVPKAIHVGERVRTETAINEGVVSLGSAAAELVAERADPAKARCLVVGAGEMGTVAAKALASRGVAEVVVANRTVERARAVADGLAAPARAVGLEDLPTALESADAVVTATDSPDPLLEADGLAGVGPTTLIDVAQPRDVAPAVADRTDVVLYDLDDLESVTDRTRKRRDDAAEQAAALVDEEFDRLLEQYKRKRADDAVAAMYEAADRVKERELRTAVDRLESAREDDLDDEEREVIESLADALVGQLLAAPTKSLREAAAEDDWATISTALQLFDPEFDRPSAGDTPGESSPVGRADEDA
jgi:glutamyl-tRNA reductase